MKYSDLGHHLDLTYEPLKTYVPKRVFESSQ